MPLLGARTEDGCVACLKAQLLGFLVSEPAYNVLVSEPAYKVSEPAYNVAAGHDPLGQPPGEWFSGGSRGRYRTTVIWT